MKMIDLIIKTKLDDVYHFNNISIENNGVFSY